jgi:hypothetical protein
LNSIALTAQWVFNLKLELFFLIPNLSFLILYILGSMAAAKLLHGHRLGVYSAYFSALVCVLILPFAVGVWIVPVIIASLAFIKFQYFDDTPGL